MKAQPGPMVSGSHFFPKAPLLWEKWMPAWAVMSRKVMRSCAWLAVAIMKTSNHSETESRRKALLALGFWLLAKGQKPRAKNDLSACHCNSVVDFILSDFIIFGPRELWRRE